MDSYMADYVSVYRKLYHAHLQEVGLTHIPANHVRVKGCIQLVQPLDGNQGAPTIAWSHPLDRV